MIIRTATKNERLPLRLRNSQQPSSERGKLLTLPLDGHQESNMERKNDNVAEAAIRGSEQKVSDCVRFYTDVMTASQGALCLHGLPMWGLRRDLCTHHTVNTRQTVLSLGAKEMRHH